MVSHFIPFSMKISRKSRNGLSYGHPERFCGTPLYETMIDSFAITDKFMSDYPSIEKYNTIYITDGDGNPSRVPLQMKYKKKMFFRNKDTSSTNTYSFLRTAYEDYFEGRIKMTNIFLKDSRNPYYGKPLNKTIQKELQKNGIIHYDTGKNNRTILEDDALWSSRYIVMMNASNDHYMGSLDDDNDENDALYESSALNEIRDDFVSSGVNRKKMSNIFRTLSGQLFA